MLTQYSLTIHARAPIIVEPSFAPFARGRERDPRCYTRITDLALLPGRALKVIPSLIVIIACGGVGAAAGWELVATVGWTGVGAALTAALVGMIVATFLFAAGIALYKAMRRS